MGTLKAFLIWLCSDVKRDVVNTIRWLSDFLFEISAILCAASYVWLLVLFILWQLDILPTSWVYQVAAIVAGHVILILAMKYRKFKHEQQHIIDILSRNEQN